MESDTDAPERNDATADASSNLLLDRRSYLRLSAAAAAVVGTGAAATTASAATPTVDLDDGDDVAPVLDDIGDGDTVVLPEDGRFVLSREVDVDADDWSFHGNGSTIEVPGEFMLYLRGTGWDFGYVNWEPRNDADPQNWLSIHTRGTDWKCHHIAWTKPNRTYWGQDGDYGRMTMFVPGTDPGGTGEISDCWMGHGWRGDNGFFAIAPWNVGDGDLWIRRCYFRHGGTYFPPNADKGPDDPDTSIKAEGTLNVDTCYFEACYEHCVRTGAHYGKSVVRNTVMNQSQAVKDSMPWSRGDSLEDGQWAARGIFNYAGPVEAIDCEIDATADQTNRVASSLSWGIRQEAQVAIEGGNIRGDLKGNVSVGDDVGSDPDLTPPDGVPTSPEEAYKGAASNTEPASQPSEDHEHTLTIRGTGTATNYEFTVSESLSARTDDTLESWDEIHDTTANGWVTTTEHVDKYAFDGDLTDFTFHEGEAAVYLDGEEYAVDELTADHTLTLQGTGTATNYEFSVSKSLSARTDDTLESWDEIHDTTANGWVTTTEHVDKYAFDGRVTEFDFVEGDAAVYLDGEEVDPSDLVGEHTLRIQGTGTPTNYEFSVSDSLSPGDARNLESWDEIHDTTANGWVTTTEHVDTYQFTGIVERFDFVEGEATVYLDGSEVTTVLADGG